MSGEASDVTVDEFQGQATELEGSGTYLNDAILVDIFEHLIHHGGDDLLRTTSDGQSDGGCVEITRESLSGENWFSLEEIPFAFMLDEGNEISDGIHEPSVRIRKPADGGEILTGRMWLLI